jgi:predicted dehydrogenase
MMKWGVVGLGHMAHQFAESIKEIDNAKLISISSSSNSKLKEFGDKYSIEKKNRFNQYQDIINSEADAVYISTLNYTHSSLIKILINSSKKVLCEKPFVINYNEALELSEIIKEDQNNFYEAIAYRSSPQIISLLNLIKDGEIGKIYKIESTFGFRVRRVNPKSRLFNKKTGGGAILDVGCYPVSFVNLFNKNGKKLEIKSVKGSLSKTGVDDHAELIGTINGDIQIELKVSLKNHYKNNCIIYGSNGVIKIPSPWLPEKKTYLEVNKDKSYYKKFVTSDKSVYANQTNEITKKFLKLKTINSDLLVNIDESVEIAKILTSWREHIK